MLFRSKITDANQRGITFKPREEFVNKRITENASEIMRRIRDLYQYKWNSRNPIDEQHLDDSTTVQHIEEHLNKFHENDKKRQEWVNLINHSPSIDKQTREILVRYQNALDSSFSASQRRGGYFDSQTEREIINIEKLLDPIRGIKDNLSGKTIDELARNYYSYFVKEYYGSPLKNRQDALAKNVKLIEGLLQKGEATPEKLKGFVQAWLEGNNKSQEFYDFIDGFGKEWDKLYPMTLDRKSTRLNSSH